MKTQKQLNLGLGILFLFLFISRIIDNPLMVMVSPAANPPLDLFGIPLANTDVYMWAKLLDYDNVLLGGIRNGFFTNMSILLGLAITTFFMERAFIPKAHHVFFIILMVCAFIVFIPSPTGGGMIDIFDPAPNDPVANIFAYLGYFTFIVIPLLYLILAGKTTGPLRRNALFLAFGFIFILVDIHTVGHAGSGTWMRAVPCLVGFAMIGAINLISQTQKVDGALVDFYTSKHVCIVHKGEIKGPVFMCKKCNAYYCVKCKEAIEGIDKCCWSCKTPFGTAAAGGTPPTALEEVPADLPQP
jgi:hypothetical protein